MNIAEALRILTADCPPAIWYVPSLILLFLAFTAIVDAFTGRVPDAPIAIGAFGGICGLAWYAGWFVAGERLLYAIAAVVALKLTNNLYHRLFDRDAFGFGDAKWTGLAVVGFGAIPVFWAWVVGAWLGLIWMAARWFIRLVIRAKDNVGYVHFAPFLFLGLVASLFRDWLMTLVRAWVP